MPPTELLISAGEASGDMYAAQLARALRQRADVHLFGMGGPRMREAGVEIVVDCAEVGVTGIFEVARKIPALRRAMRRLRAEAVRRRPPLAILTDFPSFHLRLARTLHRRGVQNVYFVCPQFWAWRPWRVNLVRRRFVRGLCLFPFETDFYRQAGVAADWIGHPLVGRARATLTRAEFAARHGLDPGRPIITLLPGSRPSELAHHMPRLMESVARLGCVADRQFLLAVAPGLSRAHFQPFLPAQSPLRLIEDATYDALAAADVAIVSSGTATIETALLGTPMVVVYRVAPATAWIARRLMRAPYIAMVNLLAQKLVVPELIQEAFTPEQVAREVERLLASPEARAAMQRDLAEVSHRLGPPGAIDRAAAIIAVMLRP
ncbi:MAG TPA: lipid-A-disaccharide synthase [Candidatus Acidoferrales bacterium]